MSLVEFGRVCERHNCLLRSNGQTVEAFENGQPFTVNSCAP